MRRIRRRRTGRRRRGAAELGTALDPMVDVVFQLLIFFLFTFQLRVIESVHPTRTLAPGPSAATPTEPPPRLELTATPEGSLAEVLLDGRPVGGGLDELAGRLAELAVGRAEEDRKVIVRPAASLRYGDIVAALRTVRAAGWVAQLASAADDG